MKESVAMLDITSNQFLFNCYRKQEQNIVCKTLNIWIDQQVLKIEEYVKAHSENNNDQGICKRLHIDQFSDYK